MRTRDPPRALKPSRPSAIIAILFSSFALLYATTLLLPGFPSSSPLPNHSCDLFSGQWITAPRPALYDASCPFHRNAWNCHRNGRDGMASINALAWVPDGCGGSPLPRIDPAGFLESMRGRRIGFVGDSLNENFLVAFLCSLRAADAGVRKWKRKGAWRGGYFPKFDVTVAYHRAVLLARYRWQPVENSSTTLSGDGLKGIHIVDVDVPADDWVNVTKFYDVLVFNTGHWWGPDKFPEETPLVFFKEGKPIVPALGIRDGLKVVLKSMISYIEKEVPKTTLKYWRSQSPRHFHGGDWDHNGSCLFTNPLSAGELDLWFDPSKRGVNKEAREINSLIKEAIDGSDIRLLNLTHMSEFRADAHPAIWLGKKDAVEIWGQDCMHWCLPGVPDTWVDVLVAKIKHDFGT